MTAVSAVILSGAVPSGNGDDLHRRARRAGEFGLAIAYSSVLIVVMLAVIRLIDVLVGERHLRRRTSGETAVQFAG